MRCLNFFYIFSMFVDCTWAKIYLFLTGTLKPSTAAAIMMVAFLDDTLVRPRVEGSWGVMIFIFGVEFKFTGKSSSKLKGILDFLF